jgi:hypothetical protein
MAKRGMDVVKLIQQHGDKIPRIQKLLGQKEKLEGQSKTVARRLRTVEKQLNRLIAAVGAAPRKRRKKKKKAKKKIVRKRRKKKARRAAKPNVGSTAYLAAQVMSRKKPMKAERVVSALRKKGKRVNLGTVKHGLSHYPFFKNIRGEGFTYTGPALPALRKAKKKKAKKKAVKRTVKKKAVKRKAARKKTAERKAVKAAAPSSAPVAEGQA